MTTPSFGTGTLGSGTYGVPGNSAPGTFGFGTFGSGEFGGSTPEPINLFIIVEKAVYIRGSVLEPLIQTTVLEQQVPKADVLVTALTIGEVEII